jgi:hypothetical protein
MSLRTLCLSVIVVVCLVFTVIPVQASDGSTSMNVIYQTPFSSDPHWTTNSPSYDYWDPSSGRYHFSIEPSTGNYAYATIDNMAGSFTFEYDVTFERVDSGSAFRFGLTGSEMDFNKGPNIITVFSNGKYENLMSLHLVTVGSKQQEVNSKTDDELTSGSIAYKGPTVKFALNKTYHVVVDYVEETGTTTMRVSDKASGKEIWSYFIKTTESMRDMNRIYLGSRGDYGSMYTRVTGYIDNVRLSKPGAAATPAPLFESTTVQTTAPPVTTKKPAVLHTSVPTTLPTETPQSSSDTLMVFLALGIIGSCFTLRGMKKY